jgi:hypothetical protein
MPVNKAPAKQRAAKPAAKKAAKKAASKPAAKKPTAKKPTAAKRKPAATKPAAKRPATRKAAGKTAAAKRSAPKGAATKAAAKQSAAKQSAAKQSAAKQSAADKGVAARYTDPALRERLKGEITAGTRGGKAGQWSARKAQLLARAYEEAGGGYTGKRDARQQHLAEWTAEEWTTADGRPAERGDGTHRYLPQEAWEKLTPAQRRATDRKKVAGSRRGRQFVANTEPARRARKESQ